MAQESKITVSVIDETIGLGVNPGDKGLSILCPIVSPTGPTKLTKVSGPSQLKRLFNGGRPITNESNKTLQYARALSNHSPLYIKRAARGGIMGGKSSGMRQLGYVDEYLNPIDVTEMSFSTSTDPYSKYIESIYSEVVDNAGDGFVRMSPTSYNLSASSLDIVPDNSTVSKSIIEYTPSYVLKLDMGATPTTGVYSSLPTCTITIGTDSITSTDFNNWYSLFKSLCINSKSKPVFINASTKDDYKFCYDYKSNDLLKVNELSDKTLTWTSIPDSDSDKFNGTIYLVYSTPVSVKCNDSSLNAQTKLDQLINVSDTISGSKLYLCSIKAFEEFTNEYDLSCSFTINKSESDEDVADSSNEGTKIYEFNGHGTLQEIANKTLEGINPMYSVVTNNRTSLIVEGKGYSYTPINASGSGGSTSELSVTADKVIPVPMTDKFLVVSKNPNDTDCIGITISTVSEDVYKIIVAYENDSDEVWTISFVPGATDTYGSDIYYTYVNRESDLINIVELSGSVVIDGSFKIGSQVTNDLIEFDEAVTANCMVNALNEMVDIEESPVQFKYIVDSGIINTSLSTCIKKLCDQYFSFYPASCDVNNLTMYSLTNRRSTLESVTGRGNFIAAAQSTAALDRGTITLPGGYYYLTRRIDLFGSVQEYLPIFGKTNGGINIVSPTKAFRKSERESLLGKQIITLAHSMEDDSWYLNDNLTTNSVDSFLQEDGIALMCNDICKISYNYAKTLIGQYNTESLRNQVEITLNMNLRNALRVGTQNGPDSVTVVCNEDNNPVALRNQRVLRIDVYGRFNRSIHDVLIYTHVQPLGS